jgi:hypothetical protein
VRLAASLIIVLSACAAYEAAIALEWIPIGNAPGEGATASGWALGVALLAMLAAAFGCVATFRAGSASFALVAPAAAAFMVARFYTFDPYYAPALRRASDGGLSPTWWIYVIAALAIAAAALRRVSTRGANSLACAVLLVCALTAFAMYGGH